MIFYTFSESIASHHCLIKSSSFLSWIMSYFSHCLSSCISAYEGGWASWISIWQYLPGASLLSFVLEPSFSTLPSAPIDSLPSGFLLGLAPEGRWEAGSLRWPIYLPNPFPGGHQILVASLNWCSQLITAFTQFSLLSFKNCPSSHPSRSKNGNRLPCDFPTPCPHLWT